MEDEFQRDQPFLGIGARVLKLGGELLDLIDHTRLRWTIRGNCSGWQRRVPEASSIKVRIAKFDVHEMPLMGLIVLPRSASVGVPIPVCPGGFAGDVVSGQIVGVGGKHRCDLFPDGRIEKPLGNQCDDLVALVSPRERGSGCQGDIEA
jgi:hypothetical protein